jgi:uncharacterized protein YfaT (DUF1175 family)
VLPLGLIVVAVAPGLREGPSPAIVGRAVGEIALAQATAIDRDWNPEQRDCAGLVRFAYRSAHKRLDPRRLERPLWLDREGRPSAFADAESLIEQSFRWLGRDHATAQLLHDGDLLAFRQDPGDGSEPVFHLMIVARRERTWVVYHPGSQNQAVRAGPLDELKRGAPLEWRPVPENRAFLGFYRWKEW